MGSSVVVIPCFNRPEFLSVCLELITMAERSDENLYLFQVDFGYDPEVLKVIESFQLRKQVELTPNHDYPNKQSFSLLEGYKNALTHNPDRIYLIEDDIFIANDFFIWHEKHLGINFASIATLNHNNTRIRHSNNLAVVYTDCEYQSLGVCFNKRSVEEILKNVTELYFKDPQAHIKKTFPASRIPVGYCEQDGLIRRIIHAKRHKVVYPHVPRAFHAGYYGKSRGEKPQGTLEERIAQVKLTAFDPDIMKGDSKPELLMNPIY